MDQNGMDDRLERVMEDATLVANTWRLAGRWEDALTLLHGMQPVAAQRSEAASANLALEIARVLSDQGVFARMDTALERKRVLEHALTQAEAADSDALRGACWDAKGMSLHVTFLWSDRRAEPPDELPFFERGLTLRRSAGDQRGVAESLFHIGMVYGVVREDDLRARPYLQEAYDLAREVDDRVLESYAIRHLAFAHFAIGDTASAQAALAESLHLREDAGFTPGVAMALIACAEAAKREGDRAAALAFLDRARSLFADLHIAEQVAWVETLIAEASQSH